MLVKLIETAKEYAIKHNFSFELLQFKYSDLIGSLKGAEQDHNWSKFESKPGVYVFSTNNEILYVGKSGVDVGTRIDSHFSDDEKMDRVTEDSDIIVFSFSEEFKSLTCALESYLIINYSPLFNKTEY